MTSNSDLIIERRIALKHLRELQARLNVSIEFIADTESLTESEEDLGSVHEAVSALRLALNYFPEPDDAKGI